MLEYENIKAENLTEARKKLEDIVDVEFANDWNEISETEIMLVCHNCSTDNDHTNKYCEQCGEQL